jgi:magnesium transporter
VITPVLTRDDLMWVDVVDPSSEDIAALEQQFSFHQLALEDVERRHQRPKLDEYPGYYFGVLYAMQTPTEHAQPTTTELQFFWGKNYLVTIHSETVPELDDLIGRARSGSLVPIVNADSRPLQAADVMYRLLDAVVDGYFPAVDALAEWTDDIEEQMFSGQRRPRTLQSIFAVRKTLINLRKVVAPGREVINSLLRHDQALFDDSFYPYFQDVYDHTVRVIDTLDTYRDLLGTALDTYLSIVSNDVSQTVKTMTAVTAILMADALIAGIYGMNFDIIPELHWQYGYPWALGLMAASSLALWLLFRRLRWL